MSDSENSKNYSNAIKERRYVRSRVTKIYNSVSNNLDSLNELKRGEYIIKLRDLKEELKIVNRKVFQYSNDDEADDDMLEVLLHDEEEYDYRVTIALATLDPVPHDSSLYNSNANANIGNVSGHSHNDGVVNKLKLPTVDLPTFSNDKSECLEQFFHAFESILDKHNLSDYEKFVYLKSHVSKSPRALINSLSATEQSYQSAKKLLEDAFASPLNQRYKVIKKLSELKLTLNSDVYEFISEIRSIRSSIDIMKIDIELIIQYFVWNSMNERFQDQLVQITNNPKPTLQLIMDNIFPATERYLRLNEKIDDRKNKQNFSTHNKSNDYSSPVRTNNLAINVNSPKIASKNICPLCTQGGKSASHSLRDCRTYPTPTDKVNKLRSLNYCAKCSFMNHSTDQCRFKFKSNCRQCSGSHLSFLCITSNNDRKQTHSNLSTVHFNSTIGRDNISLPTFSVSIEGESCSRECKVLNDTGSQRNFISGRLVQSLNLNSIKDDVDLIIHGFNSSKNVKTRIVELNIKVGDKCHSIEAIVIPSINLKMEFCKLLDVRKMLLDLDYEVADNTLGSSSDVDMVMGPDAAKILRPSSLVISDEPDPIVYLSTHIGLMLMGDVDKIYNEVSKLSKKFVDQTSSTHNDINSDSVNSTNINTFIDVLNDKGQINERKLNEATSEILEQQTDKLLNYDYIDNSESNELNDGIVDYLISNAERSKEGRLIMPIPWNPDSKHLLGNNYYLSKKILYSNLDKLKRNGVLSMYDDVLKEQEQMGIIERIEDVDRFRLDHPKCSFLPHMGVVKMNRDTTKVRIVYLANLCEKNNSQQRTVSHNEAMLPGPCLNNKISTSLLMSRFDKYILIFDIKKAFLNIELGESDQNKLMCLWFNDIANDDYSLICYRNLRLSFGLRPSPAVLMVALYKILMIDNEYDDEFIVALKRLIYANIYMDNGLVSSNSEETLSKYYSLLPGIFQEYKFELQQFATNSLSIQKQVDMNTDEPTDSVIKLLGMQWNRNDDTLSPSPINLDSKANTKRKLLSTLNSVYDLFNVYSPILNRARLYFHKLQCDRNVEWDTILSSELLKEWNNICKEVNNSPPFPLNRYIGPRDGIYDMVAFCDSSALIYGVVIYVIEIYSKKVSFLLSRNKIINSKTAKKSIPSLECQGVSFAVETMVNVIDELSGKDCVLPITINDKYIYTDSMVTLSWIKGYFSEYEKMQKKSTYVQNRLKNIADNLKGTTVTFRFIEGRENPSDYVTRAISPKRLAKTNYFDGPSFLSSMEAQHDLEVTVPCKAGVADVNKKCDSQGSSTLSSIVEPDEKNIIIENYSSFKKIVRIYYHVLKFIKVLKLRIQNKEISSFDETNLPQHLMTESVNSLVKAEQQRYFPEIIKSLEKREIASKIPNLVLQLNLFLDEDGLIRVKGKFNNKHHYLILLPNNSHLTTLIVRDMHEKFMHSGVYFVLRELRKSFWILKGFSTVRRILRNCIRCKRVNERPIKLNQGEYREFRVDPPKIPFSSVFLDYIGPINIKMDNVTKKIWILIITCLWSRAVSLKICFSADTREFLRNIQLHIYEFGMFRSCMSDLGSQITAGVSIIDDFLNEPLCLEYFKEHGIEK